MLPLWRVVPRASSIGRKGIFSVAQSGYTPPTSNGTNLPHASAVVIGGMDSSFNGWPGPHRIEGVQGALPTLNSYTSSEGKDVLSTASQILKTDRSVQGVQDVISPDMTVDTSMTDVRAPMYEGLNSHVSLYGCMQSNVPHPTSNSAIQYGSFHGMPGAGGKLFDKYLSAGQIECHQSRHFSTSAMVLSSVQGAQEFLKLSEEDEMSDRCPQGIQGDDCVRFKLWMENCYRYHLPNCDEQAEAITMGKKTLAQVFKEQEEIIREVAETYRKQQATKVKTLTHRDDAQGVQDAAYGFSSNITVSCPQGIQGEDCDTYRLWSHNCDKFGFANCQENYESLTTGRRSLKDIFDEQDRLIREVVHNYQQRRSYSTQSPKPTDGRSDEVGMNTPPSSSSSSSSSSLSPGGPELQLSQRARLKRAVKDYGATVVVFHIGIALTSLGGFYMAVSSGLDVVGLLSKMGVGEGILKSQLAAGASTFVIAYAVHKVFAPVRIAITLTCTPLIVRFLRQKGILKPPKIKPN